VFSGAVHEIVDCRFSNDVATTFVGAPGGSARTIGFDSADATEVPAEFEAVAVNV